MEPHAHGNDGTMAQASTSTSGVEWLHGYIQPAGLTMRSMHHQEHHQGLQNNPRDVGVQCPDIDPADLTDISDFCQNRFQAS